MRIAVLFDGAGLARLGLEQAGHECVGYELDPAKHYLSKFIGSGNCILADATKVDLSGFDGVWMSSPCQENSPARTQGAPVSEYAQDYLPWCVEVSQRYPEKVTWIENVLPFSGVPKWATLYNAAQFLPTPIQSRQRIIGGKHLTPEVYRPFRQLYPQWKICPAVTATEYRGCATDKRRASRFYGRRLTLDECAFHQGFTIPEEWYAVPDWFIPRSGVSKKTGWMRNLYEAIGNGVPVYMARGFGLAYSQGILIQSNLFAEITEP